MYREAPKYRSAASYTGFREELAQVSMDEVRVQLELRFDDSAKQLFDRLTTRDCPTKELAHAMHDFTLVATAADYIDPSEPKGFGAIPGWMVKARRKLLDTWDTDYHEAPRIDPRQTPFFDNSYAIRSQLQAGSNNFTMPRFDYDGLTLARGVALGRVGISTDNIQ